MLPNRQPVVQPIARIAANWRLVAVTCLIAVLVSLIATLLLPKKFTAVTRIFIEAPAGTDSRASTAVSPIYLDSLRTYEIFASSDSLFLQAVERFHLRQSSTPVDRLKKSILKVTVPRNTKVLEISATWTEPKLAHDLALYLAEETVKINETTSRQGDRESAAEAGKEYAAAKARMDAAQRAWDTSPDQVTGETLRSEVLADDQLRDGMRRELTELEVSDPDATGAEGAKIIAYRRRLALLSDQMVAKRRALALTTSHIESLETELGAARRTFAGAESRLQDLRAAAGSRGERLRIVDPGIVPEHPSSPDLMLNLAIALIAGAILSVAGLLLTAPDADDETPRRKPVSIAAK